LALGPSHDHCHGHHETAGTPLEEAPELYESMLAFSNAVAGSGLDTQLAELVKIRASQLNGCAYCIDMHT
jgi:alkylhydroperoxidase family enzyme